MYNKAVDYINKEYESENARLAATELCCSCNKRPKTDIYTCDGCKKKSLKRKYVTFPDLRSKVVVRNSDVTEETKWLLDIPQNTRQLAVRAAINSRATSLALRKANLIKFFKLSFKSRKDVTKIAYFDASSLAQTKSGLLSFSKTGFLKENCIMKTSRRGAKDLKLYFSGERSDYSIVLEGYDDYYLCLSTLQKRQSPDISEEKREVLALDPGIRVFMTGYSPQGELYTTNDVTTDKLKKLFTRVDSVASAHSDKNKSSKTKRRLHERKLKLFKKVKDVVNDMHIHVAKSIASNYKTVILPSFGTSKMLSEKKLHHKTKRLMGALSFYKFKNRLIETCSKYDTEIKIVTEEYTSMTCTRCGNLHPALGSNKVYKCKCCGLTIDRDVNGARNILLKHI